jgi:PKD repeat protein
MKKTNTIKSLLLIIIMITGLSAYTQQGNIWCFGNGAGLNFSNGSPTSFSQGQSNSLHGISSISDSTGNLLFYSDGITIWDKNHTIMETGLMGHNNSAQSVLIVPAPLDNNKYYIFTTDAASNNLSNGFRYSIVDMNLRNGLGDVVSTSKNILLSPSGVLMAEKITSVHHCNKIDIWVVAHGYGTTYGNKFYAYKITSTGIITSPVISTVGTIHNGANFNGNGNARGCMTISPSGSRLALAISYDGTPALSGSTWWQQMTLTNNYNTGSFEVFDFDNTSGTVSNPIKFSDSDYKGAFGVAFSPNDSFLYGSTWGTYGGSQKLFQWNLFAGSNSQVQNSKTRIDNSSFDDFGTLQLGPNGKIYIAIYNQTYIGAINYPNNLGTSCGFTSSAVSLGTQKSNFGLPNYIQSYFDPQTGFSYNNNFKGMSTKFWVSNSAGFDSLIWFFNDPGTPGTDTSISTNPDFQFSDTGTYQVTLLVFRCNIVDSFQKTVTIWPSPNAAFSLPANDYDICFGHGSFNFINNSTIASGNVVQYLWKFGDGDTSSQTNPSHQYSAVGIYPVTLFAWSNKGAVDSFSYNVSVLENPKARFSINSSNHCFENNYFNFSNQSTVVSSTVDSIFWSFGDGNTSILFNPVHSYNNIDTYTVEMICKAVNGCSDTIQNEVYIRPMPNADFSAFTASKCKNENNFRFTNNSTIDYGSLTYIWDFGNQKTSTNANANYKYLSHGNYDVSLIVESDFNCIDTITQTYQVLPSPNPKFYIATANSCLRDNENSLINTSHILGGGSLQYFWDFGDNTTDTAENLVKSYQNSGTYLIRLIAKSDSNCYDTFAESVTVYEMPQADFSVNTDKQCFNSNQFEFTNNSIISSGQLTYEWSFDDGNYSKVNNPVYNYSIIDTFQVRLVARSNENCLDTSYLEVITLPDADAKFTINDSIQCFNGNEFIFNNLSKTQTGTLNYKWYFGEKDSSEMNSPTYYAKTSDTLKIKLFAFNNGGCIDSVFNKIIVLENPKADFIINDSEQCLDGNKFIFTSNSTDSIIQQNWNFGDGNLSFEETDSNQYTSDGTYDISLIVINNFYCKDSITKSVTVFPQPQVSLGKDTMIYNDQIITLDAGSGFISYDWNTADTTQTIDVDGSQTGLGFFDYWVAVTDQNNCSNSDTITIEVQKSIGIPEESITYKIFPNPTSDKIYIRSDNSENKQIELFVVNLNGQVLYHDSVDLNSQNNIHQIDISNYKKGVYLLKVTGSSGTFTNRIIKN